MKKITDGVGSQQETRNCVRAFAGDERKPAADEQEVNLTPFSPSNLSRTLKTMEC